jgi:hypothetical protein
MAKLKERPAAAPAKEPSQKEREEAAYYHWLERGRPEGDALTDWLEVQKGSPATGSTKA